jgi:chemotaxis protein methyltransferase CheR
MTPAELVRALQDTDPEVRRHAVLQARKLRASALAEGLLAALGDRDFRVRQEAIDALIEQAVDLDLLPALVGALTQDENVGQRNAARDVLRGVGGAAVGTLVQALSEVAPPARKFVVEALAGGGSHAALPALLAAARSADASLSAAAMDGLAHLGGDQATAALRECLKDGSVMSRAAALEALIRLGARLPWDDLAAMLSERTLRRVAIDALGYSGDARAVRPLLASIEDKSVHVAQRAVLAMARLAVPGSTALPALVAALRQASEVSRSRIAALADHDDPDVAQAAAVVLAHMRTSAAPPSPPLAAIGQAESLDAETFQRLRGLVNRAAGLLLPDDARALVERKLEGRVQALRASGFAEYVRSLSAGAERHAEMDRLLDALTTHETYFFRDLPQLYAFEHEVLPTLEPVAKTKGALTVWSAGCSTGEEVYSLAILIHRSGRFRDVRVRVIGSDLSARVLDIARRGAYREPSFRAMPMEHARYFVRAGEERAPIPEIMAMCEFEQRNLLDGVRLRGHGAIDVIFCRNVLIYFDTASRRRVVENFYDALRPGGYLMLGHSESLLHMSTAFELAHMRGDLGYRKPVAAGPVRS